MRGELLAGRRDEELDQPAAAVRGGPVAKPAQPGELILLEVGGVGRVEPHQDLDPVGVELLDVLSEVVAVLEPEPVRSADLGGHGEHEPRCLRPPGDVGAKLLVHQDPELAAAEVGAYQPLGGLEDQ